MLIQDNYKKFVKKFLKICNKYKKNPKKIILIAVTKNQSVKKIQELIKMGQVHFGENYVKESIEKIQKLKNKASLIWHYIGSIQSNKSRFIAENYSWCHSIERINIAIRLNKQRPYFLPPLNILIQINYDAEENKSGILLNELSYLVRKIINMNFFNLRLRGFMIIPRKEKKSYNEIVKYQKIFNIFKKFNKKYPNIDTLSLGMSNDLESAILSGSNMIRIGTGIFGIKNRDIKIN